MQNGKLAITINAGTLTGRTFELETGFLSIGRSETCSIRFDPLSERIASKQHAFIEARADGYYLTDNQSTNGTFLNGSPISSARLSNGDHIQFGKNGVSAVISIQSGDVFGQLSVVDYRSTELEQFTKVAKLEPANVSASFQNFGLGAVAEKVEPSKAGRYVGIAITLFAVAFLALIVVFILSSALTAGAAIIAAVIAFIPASIYVIPLIWLDRYDPEPSWLLALSFAWGALVAVIISYFVNTNLEAAVYQVTASADAAIVVGSVISAPVFEEASKGMGVLLLLLVFRRYFDDILDGIVFAGVIALGFATVENVLYYGRTIQETGVNSDEFKALFVVRGIFSPFAHVTFTAMTGIGCGIARESHNKAVRFFLPIVGYCAAVILHALWNGAAVFGGFALFAIGYVIAGIPFFLIFVGFSFYIMRRQNKILREMLAIDVARGIVSEELVKTATSAFRSTAWLVGGLFSGRFLARNRYLRAIGKLGLSYWHIQRATVAMGETASFQQNPILREEVLKWREQI